MMPRALLASALALPMWANPVLAQPPAISINFSTGGGGVGGAGPFDLATTDMAGVVPLPNWNNIPSANGGPSPLNNALGASTTATVTIAGMNNAWSIAG